jgi:hypothetical protein
MIEAAILAVPERSHLVAKLQARLAHPIAVAYDAEHVGHADAYKRAMDDLVILAGLNGASYALMLEDDAWPCERFLDAAAFILDEAPTANEPVTFFTRKVGHAYRHPWLMLTSLMGSQAIAWPVATWRVVSEWMDSPEGQQWRQEHTWTHTSPVPAGSVRHMCADNWWCAWMRRERVHAWATQPSLVEHLQEPSTIPHHHYGQAADFIGDANPFDLTWGYR